MRVGIFVQVYNEKNINEWLDYHLKCGFDFIIIIDDYSDIPVNDIIDKDTFDNNKFKVFKSFIPKMGTTNKHYNLPEIYQEYIIPLYKEHDLDYVLQIDMDEYLYLDNYNSIHDLIKGYDYPDQLYITYKIFGHNNLNENDESTILDKFTKSTDFFCRDGKSLTKIKYLKESNSSHFCIINDDKKTIDQFKNIIETNSDKIKSLPISNLNNKINVNIYIAHFMTQDVKTFIIRRLLNYKNWISSTRKIFGKNDKKYFTEDKQKYMIDYVINYDKNHNLTVNEDDELEEKFAKFFWSYNIFSNKVENLDLINFYKKNKK